MLDPRRDIPYAGPATVDAMLPSAFRVERYRDDTADTFTLELTPPEEHGPFHFEPGQFTMLYVFGVGEVPISICGDPAQPDVLVHTTRAVGGVTRGLRALRPGDRVGVRGPFGTSWPVAAAEGKDVVFIAGGIGLPPLRPAIYRVLANRERYGRVILIYGARTPEDLLYRSVLARWRTQLDFDVLVTVDRNTGSWRGSVGVCTALVPRVDFDPENTIAMICGPEIMIRFAAKEMAARGVADGDTFVSLERNMKCAVGYCGHCQLGPHLVCRDGPVFPYDAVRPLMDLKEV